MIVNSTNASRSYLASLRLALYSTSSSVSSSNGTAWNCDPFLSLRQSRSPGTDRLYAAYRSSSVLMTSPSVRSRSDTVPKNLPSSTTLVPPTVMLLFIRSTLNGTPWSATRSLKWSYASCIVPWSGLFFSFMLAPFD